MRRRETWPTELERRRADARTTSSRSSPGRAAIRAKTCRRRSSSRACSKLEDLTPGMELTGTVLNVVDFGAFVDIGMHDSGLVHVSHLADRFVRDPHEVVSVGDIVQGLGARGRQGAAARVADDGCRRGPRAADRVVRSGRRVRAAGRPRKAGHKAGHKAAAKVAAKAGRRARRAKAGRHREPVRRVDGRRRAAGDRKGAGRRREGDHRAASRRIMAGRHRGTTTGPSRRRSRSSRSPTR